MPNRPYTCLSAILLGLTSLGAAWQPTFRSGVDLIRLDVTVVAAEDGTPVSDLAAEDFDIEVDGQKRPVKSVQFTDRAFESAATGTAPASIPDYSTNTASTGRVMVIVVDEQTLVQGQERVLLDTFREFLGKMRPQDRTALISLPGNTARVDFTSDVEALQKAASRLRAWPQAYLAPAPIDIARGEGGPPRAAGSSRMTGADNPVTETLAAIADSLKAVEGPKTMVLLAGSLPGGTTELGRYQDFARRAAEARVTFYAVRAVTMGVDLRTSEGSNEQGPDGTLDGLDLIAGASGGAVFNAIARAPQVFDRLRRETTGSYVVGIEPLPGAAPNKPAKITVRVRRPGVVVRGPKQIVPPTVAPERRDQKRTLAEMLRQPRPTTDLALRVANYTTRGTTSDELKSVILAEVARRTSEATDLRWAFEIREPGGRIVGSGSDSGGEPASASTSDQVLVMSANLRPGSYTLHFAVVDEEGRRGSLERPLMVALHDAAPLTCSDLFVGEAVDGRFRPRISFGKATHQLVTFVELYSPRTLPDQVVVEFMLRDAAGNVQSVGQVPAPRTNGAKSVVQAALKTSGLGAGRYHLSAQVLVGGRPQLVVRRSVVIGL